MPPLASRSPPHPELVEGRSGGNDDPMDATREVILGPVPRISFLSSSDERMMTRRVHQRCTAPPRSSFDGRTLTRAAQDERYSAISGLALMVSRAATRPVRRTTSATPATLSTVIPAKAGTQGLQGQCMPPLASRSPLRSGGNDDQMDAPL